MKKQFFNIILLTTLSSSLYSTRNTVDAANKAADAAASKVAECRDKASACYNETRKDMDKEAVKQDLQKTTGQAKNLAQRGVQKVKDIAYDTKENVKKAANAVGNKASDIAHDTQNNVKYAANVVSNKARDIKNDTQRNTANAYHTVRNVITRKNHQAEDAAHDAATLASKKAQKIEAAAANKTQETPAAAGYDIKVHAPDTAHDITNHAEHASKN